MLDLRYVIIHQRESEAKLSTTDVLEFARCVDKRFRKMEGGGKSQKKLEKTPVGKAILCKLKAKIKQNQLDRICAQTWRASSEPTHSSSG